MLKSLYLVFTWNLFKRLIHVCPKVTVHVFWSEEQQTHIYIYKVTSGTECVEFRYELKQRGRGDINKIVNKYVDVRYARRKRCNKNIFKISK